jgi:hypothetical protein
MAGLRSRRIENILGTTVNEAGYSAFESLVTNNVAEQLDLDFKKELYGRGDPDKRELAKDVAALANTTGGVIILGIEENGLAQAFAAPGVPIRDAEITRMHQIIGSLTAPVPVFTIRSVAKPGDPTHGFIVVSVQPGLYSPHAVIVNDGFRYPRRNGSTTRYLSEPEVATAYRERFARVAGQSGRARRLGTALEAGLRPAADHAWVWVSMVPDVPGEMMLSQATFAEARAELSRDAFPSIMRGSYSWHNVAVGVHKLVLSGSPGTGPPQWLAAELHADGAGAFAMNARTHARWPTPEDESGRRLLLHDEQAVNALMSGLRFLARHARDRCAAAGDVTISASIAADREGRITWLATGRRAQAEDVIGHPMPTPGHIAESAAPLDSVADDGPGLASAAGMLATELFQQFGLPEVGQVTPEGELRRPYWTSHLFQQVEQWAAASGVTVTDDTL